MYLRIGKNRGREYLSIIRNYREPGTGKAKSKIVKSLGYLEKLKEEYADPISHYKAIVEQMNQMQADAHQPITIHLNKDETLAKGNHNRKNFGYVVLSKIYHELGLHTFMHNRSRGMETEYVPNSIMKLLVYQRIMSPGSKKKAYEMRETFFEETNYSLDDVYRSLTFFNKFKEAIQVHIHKKVTEHYNRSTELVYYDVTNYYFEIDEQDELRRKGVSKEHRPEPIIQMGLFMDMNGIPISYGLFSGNTNDCETLIPIIKKMKRDYGIGRTVVVADKGMNTSGNIVYNTLHHDGYVYSQTIRGGNKELKQYALSESGYRSLGEDYRIKSRIYPRVINVKAADGTTKKVPIDEKQVVFYSRKYDRKAKAEREAAVIKARDLVNNPSKYNKSNSYGAVRFIKNLSFDKETGAIMTVGSIPSFDEQKLREEEKFDGYYAIVTSELNKTDDEIIGIYRGLWKIEESFKVTKSDLETRPVYLSREEHIQAHFLICFIALVIARILEHKLGNRHCITRIVDSLNKANCTHLQENHYLFDYYDEILESIGMSIDFPMNRRVLSLAEIKHFLAATKRA